MLRKTLLLGAFLAPIQAHAGLNDSLDSPAPMELKRILQSNEKLLDFKEADLNGDGRSDFLFVVEVMCPH